MMADLKRKTLILGSGRQLKLYGDSLGISKSLQIAEGFVPNILSFTEADAATKTPAKLLNPHELTVDELMDLADFNIQLWMDLKAGLRKYGLNSTKLFNRDASR